MDKSKQTNETDLAKLVTMAKGEIACGKAKYIAVEEGKQGEQTKILMWIIERSPKWRSNGSAAICEEMRRLGL